MSSFGRFVVLTAVLFAGLLPAAAAADTPRSAAFDEGWKFVLVNPAGITDPTGAYENAADPAYDDSSWRAVDVPHDWSIELDPTTAAGTSSETGFLQGGLGWYRKSFTLPASAAGKRISVEFDGVYMDSVIYLNGHEVGSHPYGYTGFSVDLTSLVHTDGVTENVLAVKVRHQQPSSRWYSGSGIYRHVHLVVTDPVHVARHGTFVTTPDVESTIDDGYADVHVDTKVLPEDSAGVRVTNRVLDRRGKVVAKETGPSDLRVRHPHLWSIEDPYLYTLRTELSVRGKVVDTTSTRFGIRWFRIDANEGFFLNGRYHKIQGVDLHHDLGALGAAVNRDAIERQMRLMKSMGVNAFRTSHNPPSPEMIEVCEELGIVMMVEAFDTWRTPKRQFDYGRFFDANSDADIKEMVNAAKNSPAVILWSIGNEVPDSTSVSVGLPIARQLIADIKSIDDTRPIVIGSDKYRSVPSPDSGADQILRLLDGLGLNYNTAQSVDALHARYPDKFLFESESSSETSSRGAYQDPHLLNTGENYTPGKRAASSYDNNLASWTMSSEYGLKKDRDRKYFLGEFLWSGIDYIGEPTPYNVFPVKASFFGAMDTAGFPKDAYYIFRSQWTKEPMVHLTPMNWTDHEPGQDVEVWAYANVDTVELFLNGESLGVRRYDHKVTTFGKEYLETTEPTGDDKTFPSGSYTSPNGSTGKLHLTWHVPFAPGRLVAVARKDGAEVARDVLKTAGEPDTLRLTPDREVVRADGRSLAFVTVDVVDKHGAFVPGADNRISFDVSGGTLVGLDNGRQESAENYKATARRAFNGKALAIVQSDDDAGPITVKATSPGLLPATTTVHATDATGKKLIGFDAVAVRAAVGDKPALPATVEGAYADGSTKALPVTWDRVPEEAGRHTVSGDVKGTSLDAEATVSVYEVGGIESWSTVVPAGTRPQMPATVRLVFTDGVERQAPVAWDAIDPSQYAAAGQFVVRGTVAGTSRRALASIRVTEDVARGVNIARAASPLRPSADASYSGAPTSVPAGLLDGTTATGGWSNFYNKAATALLPAVSSAHASDWVSVRWPNPQTFGTMVAYFTTSTSRALPSAVEVTYWDGSRWAPVSNLDVTWATASNQPTTITFDPVATTEVRLEMTSPRPNTNTGFLQLAELQVIGDEVAYNATAALADLRVNGETVPGFDPATTSYAVRIGPGAPEITATAADNGRLLVVPPQSLPGTATVTVTAEDGAASKTYSVLLVTADLGTRKVGSQSDENSSGQLEASRSVASFGGTIDAVKVYVDRGATAGWLLAGVYADDGGHPGRLLTSGVIERPKLRAWNTVALPSATVAEGEPYWIAVAGAGGTLVLRDECCGAGGSQPTEVYAGTVSEPLPATWRTGSVWPTDGPISAYAPITPSGGT